MEYSIFGCRLNKYYLHQWLQYFRNHSFPASPYLITTCEVTDRAKQKRIKLAKKKLMEGYHLYITWCGTLTRGKIIESDKFYALYPDFLDFSHCITLLPESPSQLDILEGDSCHKLFDTHGLHTPYPWLSIHTKKFIVIQNGCDNWCSFCLTVQKRGNHVSRPCEDIVQEINDFVVLWGKEIVLTWVNIAAWWCSNSTRPEESKLARLLQYILDHTTIPRIRLSSLGPEYLHDDFFAIIKNPRILPHFHLSIQSFSADVLHRMRRNYTNTTLADILTKFCHLDIATPVSLGADIIIGFPWETEKAFQETLQWIKKYRIHKVHSFPFSSHQIGQSISAASLPDQIDSFTKKYREKKLNSIVSMLDEQFYQMNVWRTHCVLVEGNGSWWTENYIKVKVAETYIRWEIIQVIL